MTQHKRRPIPTMQGPAIYRVCVRGHLRPDWSGRLSGMNITYAHREEDGEEETILVGRLADQAALSGVLNSLYELHMPVTSVECLESR